MLAASAGEAPQERIPLLRASVSRHQAFAGRPVRPASLV